MTQVIDAGPEIGLVEFPGDMTDDQISEALSGELKRLQRMPSRQPALTAPGEGDVAYANGRPPSEAEQAAAVANPDVQKMQGREAARPSRLDPEQEERSARESILQRQYDQAGMIDDSIQRKAKQDEILGAMRQNGFEVVKPEEGPVAAFSRPLAALPTLESPLGDLERLGVKEPVVSQVARGALNAAGGIAQFFTSPLGIATLGIGSLPAEAQQLISGAFAVDMARHAPEQFAELGKAVAEKRWDKATELALSAGATIYFAGKSGEHALYGPDGMPNPARVAGLIGERVMEEVKSGRIAMEHPNDIAVMLADPRSAEWLQPIQPATETPKSGTGTVPEPAGKMPALQDEGDEARAALLGRKGVWEASTPVEGNRVRGIWTVVDAGDLVTSADQKFDQALQPRDRSREASQNQIAEIVRRFEPERLGDAPTTDLGAPIIDERNQVLSGNGRAAALRQVYSSENQSKADAYRGFVLKQAKEMGLPAGDIAAIGKMKAPVLVRQASDFGGLNREEFARQSNQQQVLGMGEAEKAANDAKVVDRILDLWRPSEEGDVLASSNREFLNAFVKGTGDQAELLTKEGYNANALRKRVQNAVLGNLVGSDSVGRELLGHLIEGGDELGMRSVVNGVMNAAPALMRLRAVPEYDLAPVLRKALIDLVNLRREGVRVEDYVKQMDLLADPARTKETDFVVEQLANARSVKGVTEALRNYAERALKQDVKTGDMFGAKPAGREELLRSTFAKPAKEKARQRELTEANIQEHELPSQVEIEPGAFGPGTIQERRRAALNFARKELRGKTVRNEDTGADIKISGSGIEKVLGGPTKLELLPKLIEILRRAKYAWSEKPQPEKAKDSGVKAFHRFRIRAKYGEQQKIVDVVVREDQNGLFHYDHHLVDPENVKDSTGTAGTFQRNWKGARPDSESGKQNKAEGRGKQEEANIEEKTLPRRVESDTPPPATAEPVSLADIRRYLEEALDIPIRLGGFKRLALGIFKANSETIRLKLLNDITTIAHEVGHYLHYLLFPERGTVKGPRALLPGGPGASDFGKAFDKELLPLGKRTSRPSYPEDQVRREGVAEFLREWLTDRSQAFAKAPAFAKFFEETLQRDSPNVWTIVDRARQDLKRYINQPIEMKIDSRIDRKGDRQRRSATEFFREQVDDWVNELAPIERSLQKLVEFGLPARQAQMVNDLAVNYIGGWRGKVEYSLYHRQIDLAGNDAGPSLREILGGIDDTREFGNYLVAKREIELGRRGIKTGLRMEEAAEQVSWVKKMDAKYGKRAEQLYQFQRNQLALLRDSGLISGKSYAQMVGQNEFYVPFFRIMEHLGGTGMKKGEGFINLSPGVMKLKGSDRQYVDPLESVLKNAYLFRDLAERNKVARAFVDAVDLVRGGGRVAEEITKKVKPIRFGGEEIEGQLRTELAALGIELEESDGPLLENTAFTIWRAAKQSSPKEGKFTVWEDGKERAYQVGDEHLYRALSLADSNDASFFARIPFMKTMRAFTRLKRAGATLTLEFMARNPFRDQVTAAVFSKHGFVPFWDGFRGMLSAIGKDDYYWQWVKSGGRYADFISMDRKDLQSHLADVIKEPGALRFALELANPLNVVKNLQKFSELMEQATRIAEFKNAKRAGATDMEAANASKDVTLNFSRAGFKGKLVNQLVAFFNAGIQDIDKVARAHAERPLQTAMKGMLYISLPSVLAWWLGHDDDTMQKLPEWRKIGFWNVNVGKLAGKDDLVMSFPKPFLLGQLYGTSMEKALDLAYGKDPNAVRKWFMAALQATPMTLNNLLPSVATPLVENWANRSFFKGTPLENSSMQDLPPSLRFSPQTSLIARKIGGLTAIDGGGGYSPIKIDNLVRGYLAGLGKYGLDAADWMAAAINGQNLPAEPAKTIWERPLVRGFARSPYEPSAYVERFYDGLERAEQRMNGFKLLGKEDTEAAKKFYRSNRDSILWYAADLQGKSMMTRLRDARQNLGEILKAMRQVQESEIGADEKRRRLITLGKVRDAVAEAAFKAYLSPDDRGKAF
jgi:hypothetical protein